MTVSLPSLPSRVTWQGPRRPNHVSPHCVRALTEGGGRPDPLPGRGRGAPRRPGPAGRSPGGRGARWGRGAQSRGAAPVPTLLLLATLFPIPITCAN